MLAGAGQMGGALLEAWLDVGIDHRCLTVLEPRPSGPLVERLDRAGIVLNPLAGTRPSPDVLVLAVKPQMLERAAPDLLPYAQPGTLLISVLAGKTIADLRRALPDVGSIARAMPNTPAAIRRGITGVAVDAAVNENQKAAIQFLLAAVGEVEWLADENLIDAVTAVSGSGPAYVFYLTECLAKAGEAVGLEAAVAMRLARATVEGAGGLMAARPGDTSEMLRRNVTSPGGTTAAALDVLMMDTGGLPMLISAAVAAAHRRAAELSG
ncbi:pyrroline-5-carboxylate reductase [Lichenifustis flavocetrariae]|uniref:Pyrroline-5-carboxylate reductase n=1 Tax=Lichenifustis flavocetrariae TaxID=2949735 RepID=A0AA41YR65_9HYPH|nr:pyrroline-5-carboxylate reductase [Lichenifustis flavocetrariae]MCW6507049.1 pyrroline-5-carboxylate reductase [Lichenifustis flavocetrariae]